MQCFDRVVMQLVFEDDSQRREAAFDLIQPSTLHQGGFALRFPRIVRLRDDKPAAEIDTIARVEEIYREMLAREGMPAT